MDIEVRFYWSQEDFDLTWMYRASGHCLCPICGREYYDHKRADETWNLDWEGRPFLRRLCNGDLVKL